MTDDTQTQIAQFIARDSRWSAEYAKLVGIARASGLTEEWKWYKPCYTLNGNNIFLIHGFKDFCAILFHKGVLINDPKGILVSQTENTQSTRQLRFTSLAQIEAMEPTISAYIAEAIAVERSGKEVPMKSTEDFEMPDEFLDRLEDTPGLRDAFESLTPGRQRGYLLYFGSAKQSKTRTERVEKHMDRIMDGLGLDD